MSRWLVLAVAAVVMVSVCEFESVLSADKSNDSISGDVEEVRIPGSDVCPGMFDKVSKCGRARVRLSAGSLVALGPGDSIRYIACAALCDAGAAVAARMPRLAEIDLRECENMTKAGWAALAVSESLKAVKLGLVQSNADYAVRQLARCPALETLELVGLHDLRVGTGFTGESFEALSQAKRLRSLSIRACVYLDVSHFELLSKCPTLEHLKIVQCIEDKHFTALSRIPNLKRLELVSQFLTGEFLSVNGWAELRHLTLSTLTRPIEVDVWPGIANLPRLESLDLHAPKGLTGLEALSTDEYGSLTTLTLDSCVGVTAEHMRILASMPALTYLHLRACDVSDNALLQLNMSESLRTLKIDKCRKVSLNVEDKLIGPNPSNPIQVVFRQ